MASALTWTTLQQTLLVALVQAPPPYNVIPPNFTALYPQATSYAESRITRDIPMLANRTQDRSLVTGGTRTVALAGMTTLVIDPEGFALITPAGTSTPSAGTRVPYDMATLDVIDQIWPQESVTIAPSVTDWNPRYWALKDNQTIVYCPPAPAGYTIEITGLFQPTPISAANPTTYLATTYPELLTAACMVWLSGALLRNWSAQADDPKMSLSWEQTYTSLVASARDEEMRRRGMKPNAPSAPAPQGPPR